MCFHIFVYVFWCLWLYPIIQYGPFFIILNGFYCSLSILNIPSSIKKVVRSCHVFMTSPFTTLFYFPSSSCYGLNLTCMLSLFCLSVSVSSSRPTGPWKLSLPVHQNSSYSLSILPCLFSSSWILDCIFSVIIFPLVREVSVD